MTRDKLCTQADTIQTEASERAFVTPSRTILQRDTHTSDFNESDTGDKILARKQKRKKKHQAGRNSATEKKGRFSANGNVAIEDAHGVEGMESIRQIARHPPKPSRSKQKQGQKPKRHRQGNTRRVCCNEANAKTKGGGSRCVLNEDIKSYAGRNKCFAERTCLPDAVVALLPPQMKHQAPSLYVAMPKGRDAAPLDLRDELHCLGLLLERAPKYIKKGHTVAHLLLQERVCKLVVHVRLTDADENIISHFVAWDGSTVIDHPYNVKVNSTSDRSSPIKSQEAFDKLFKRHYKSRQITSVQIGAQVEGEEQSGDLQKLSLSYSLSLERSGSHYTTSPRPLRWAPCSLCQHSSAQSLATLKSFSPASPPPPERCAMRLLSNQLSCLSLFFIHVLILPLKDPSSPDLFAPTLICTSLLVATPTDPSCVLYYVFVAVSTEFQSS